MEKLFTKFSETLDKNCPIPEYPRPQMVRDDYRCLNGQWDYAILKKGEACTGYTGKILVPFSPESALSGVGHVLQPDETLHYRTVITLPAPDAEKELLLHFGAVDHACTVCVNGTEVGSHRGGYLPFFFPIGALVKEGENEITLSVEDPTETGSQARGKQALKRGGIFYTPQSGIWQTVWMEQVPKTYVTGFRITPDIDNDTLRVELKMQDGSAPAGHVVALDQGRVMAEADLQQGCAVLKLSDYKLWSPEDPQLYDLHVTAGEDAFDSYFGMRKFGVAPDEKGVQRLMLNNRPYFHNGMLDQGYWPDGLYTPPGEDAVLYDLQYTKDAGFNMLRKHIKIEPLRWYYHCDRMGILVWQDMVCGGGKFNTAVNGMYGIFHWFSDDTRYKRTQRTDPEGREQYYADTRATVELLYNSVSVCLWVPFNESWGQFDAKKAYDFVKALDDTRPIDHASGWHDQRIGDFRSLHTYFTPLFVPKREKRCVVLSEFGGYSTRVEGHIFNLKKEFGYRKYGDLTRLEDAIEKLYLGQLQPLIAKGMCAAVYTQVSDVEDEINGLMTYDRKVDKVSRTRMAKINEKMKIE